jgi:hypothetical protein
LERKEQASDNRVSTLWEEILIKDAGIPKAKARRLARKGVNKVKRIEGKE